MEITALRWMACSTSTYSTFRLFFDFYFHFITASVNDFFFTVSVTHISGVYWILHLISSVWIFSVLATFRRLFVFELRFASVDICYLVLAIFLLCSTFFTYLLHLFATTTQSRFSHKNEKKTSLPLPDSISRPAFQAQSFFFKFYFFSSFYRFSFSQFQLIRFRCGGARAALTGVFLHFLHFQKTRQHKLDPIKWPHCQTRKTGETVNFSCVGICLIGLDLCKNGSRFVALSLSTSLHCTTT